MKAMDQILPKDSESGISFCKAAQRSVSPSILFDKKLREKTFQISRSQLENLEKASFTCNSTLVLPSPPPVFNTFDSQSFSFSRFFLFLNSISQVNKHEKKLYSRSKLIH